MAETGSEADAIERLVDAVERGDSLEKRTNAQRWLDGQCSRGWSSCGVIEIGSFAPFSAFDWRPAECEVIESHVSVSRLHQLQAGAVPTPSEVDAWHEHVARYYFAEGACAVWGILSPRSAFFRPVYVAVLGDAAADGCLHPYFDHSYDTQIREALLNGFGGWAYVAAYSAYMDTVEAIKLLGFVGLADYEARRSLLTRPSVDG